MRTVLIGPAVRKVVNDLVDVVGAKVLLGPPRKQFPSLRFRLLFGFRQDERDVEQFIGTGIFHHDEIRFHGYLLQFSD
jgi:hypothetical protein